VFSLVSLGPPHPEASQSNQVGFRRVLPLSLVVTRALRGFIPSLALFFFGVAATLFLSPLVFPSSSTDVPGFSLATDFFRAEGFICLPCSAVSYRPFLRSLPPF